MNLLRQLENGRDAQAVTQDDHPFTYQDLLQNVQDLKLELTPYRRPMVVSSEALTVLSALIACQELDIPLWIAHALGNRRDFDMVAESQKIDVRIGDGGQLEAIGGGAGTNSSGAFAIHIMTSGTTGTPKIARHALDALLGRISTNSLSQGSWLLTYPPSTFAGIQVLLTAISSGSPIVAYRTQSTIKLAEAICRYSITHVSATPTFWRAALMALHPSRAGNSLRQITIGGEIVDQSLLDTLRRAFPSARIAHIFASTEAGALFSVKDGYAGFPAAWLSTKIDGVELRIQDGILQVRSPRTMQAYVSGHPSPYTADGWLSAGDLVEVRGDRVYFSGRSDAIVNVGGAKVHPEEVERFILGIEGIADVVVVGVKNALSGAVLKADVVPMPGFEPEALRQKIARVCHSALPAHKIPRIIHMVPHVTTSFAGKKSGPLE